LAQFRRGKKIATAAVKSVANEEEVNSSSGKDNDDEADYKTLINRKEYILMN
jgi:hypothetical protein